jgi:hypothetical protein
LFWQLQDVTLTGLVLLGLGTVLLVTVALSGLLVWAAGLAWFIAKGLHI